MIDIHKFYGLKGASVDVKESKSYSFGVINIAHDMIGKKFDNNVFIHLTAYDPTHIVVSTGEIYCDFIVGRITVFVEDGYIIKNIKKEVRFYTFETEPRKFIEDVSHYYAPYVPKWNK